MKRSTCFLFALVLTGAALTGAALAAEDSVEGTRSEQALEILQKADAAIKEVTSVRCDAVVRATGAARNFVGPAEGTSVLIGWNGSVPERFYTHVKMTPPGSEESVDLTGGGNGDTYFLVDHTTRKGYEDMDPGVLGSGRNALLGIAMIEFVHDRPFDDELNAETVEYQGGEKVGGEKCHKIRVVYAGGQGESIWYFSRKDYLPRRRVQVMQTPQGEGTIDRLITRLDIDPEVKPELFRMQLPSSYEQIDDFAP